MDIKKSITSIMNSKKVTHRRARNIVIDKMLGLVSDGMFGSNKNEAISDIVKRNNISGSNSNERILLILIKYAKSKYDGKPLRWISAIELGILESRKETK